MVSQPTVDWIIAATIILFTTAAAVVLRIVSIRIRRAAFNVPDYLIFFSLLCEIGIIVGSSVGVRNGGWGRHVESLSLDEIIATSKIFWSLEWFWTFGVFAFRTAILMLYMEIFCTRAFRLAAIVAATISFVSLISTIVTICVFCTPIQANWDPTIKGSCGSIPGGEQAAGSISMIFDIIVVALPLPVIWRLQLTRQRKWGISASFTVGLITAGVNLGRLIQSLECRADLDPSYCAVDSAILSTAEIAGGILAASVPTFGPLLSATRKGRASKSSPEEGLPIQTIGSIRVRPLREAGTLDESLRSQNDIELQREDSLSALAVRAADMGHQVEVGRGQSRDGPVEGYLAQALSNGGDIVRKVEYKVTTS
ncbi:hypothetical protein M434DRAFT_9736 [Hypoxylon sp. CO27-5]|nr:hypothetical protein M434DRAFT_9736 [Hypoxylon sp. CO27-5]